MPTWPGSSKVLGGKVTAISDKLESVDAKSRAKNFLAYGTWLRFSLASLTLMLAWAVRYRLLPPSVANTSNALVGGSADIATGASLFKKVNGPGPVIANIGDASIGCGPVWKPSLSQPWTSSAPCGMTPTRLPPCAL